MPTITTARTTITPITLEDAAFFVELMNSPGWIKYIGQRDIKDTDSAGAYIDRNLLQSKRENGFGYYLVRQRQGNAPMGICGFLKKPDLAFPDFGFAFLPQYGGQGMAEESCRRVFEHDVETFDFKVLDAVTRHDNVRSIRLLEKLQFNYQEALTDEPVQEALCLYRWQKC